MSSDQGIGKSPAAPVVPPLSGPHYQALDPAKILETAEHLQRRVSERFPTSNLGQIAEELVVVAREVVQLAGLLARPIGWLRALVFLAVFLLIALFVSTLVVFVVNPVTPFSSIADFLQGVDAAVNELVFLGIAIFFLLNVETRVKRRRALKAIHVLRSMAHIIDLHQLTKDPERLCGTMPDTPSSPHRSMTAAEVARYLDYCTEMLAVISKLAAIHVQEFRDPVTLSAVNDIEDLSQGLSRKIWQKIMILDRIIGPR